MSDSDSKKAEIINRFLGWCDAIGYSGDEGVSVIIVDGLPIGAKRAVQSVRFDKPIDNMKQNSTMD
jgi:hypothetical protein